MGLSIAKSYLEMLGGRIWVESEYGKGSTFYFTLPNEDYPEGKRSAINIDLLQKSDKKVIADSAALKVLIVEDDEFSQKFLTTIISKISDTILYASTGGDAVEMCRNNPDIDLVLMDIRMPGMNGYDATRQIREFNKEVIIIAQTAFGLAGDRDKSIEAGCTDYISKPIKGEKLTEMIQLYFG